MHISDVVDLRIQEFESKDFGQKTLVFFKGLPSVCVEQVVRRRNSLMPKDSPYVDELGQIDVVKLRSAVTMLLQSALSCESSIMFGIYEEFALLAPSLELLGANAVIVENNLFTNSYYPAALVREESEDLSRYFSSDYDASLSAEIFKAAQGIYADVVKYDNHSYAVCYVRPAIEPTIEKTHLFPSKEVTSIKETKYSSLEFEGDAYWHYLYKLVSQNGSADKPISIVVSSGVTEQTKLRCNELAGALDILEITYDIGVTDAYDWQANHRRYPEVEDIFRRHWGQGAEFRNLLFYKAPERSNELIAISQETIIGCIVEQAEHAIKDEDYRSVFITAPTGAGKSLLFQLPAIYLARQHRALTIVISPLIALMRDQVKRLKAKGVDEVTFVNSDLGITERDERFSEIEEGRYSIVYMSPELLVNSARVESIISKRTLGLVVIDEAHTVSTWGKDFRADYWLLGSRLKKIKRGGQRFPIACFTATAVNGGPDDTVMQTIEDLAIENPLKFIGNTRRDNITFDIQTRNKREYHGPIDEVKLDLAISKIEELVCNGRKVLVYCPYVTQVDALYDKTSQSKALKPLINVWKYHGKCAADQKVRAEEGFGQAKSGALLCTKAFGMGIDIKDISSVYHFAPTGGLADYVQEVGRAGRNPNIDATAYIDFFSNDMRYVRSLSYMGGIRAWQLRAIMSKIYQLYENAGRKQNLLVSPESFSHLFESDENESQFKRAIKMIQDDLLNRYGFPVLIARSQAIFTKNFVNVPDDIFSVFESDYSPYITNVFNPAPRVKVSHVKNKPNIRIKNTGKIIEFNMGQLWEDKYGELTFPQFKKQFFDGTLFENIDGIISPRKRLRIAYRQPFDDTIKDYNELLKAIEDTLRDLKKRGAFKKSAFSKTLKEKVQKESKKIRNIENLLDFFVGRSKSQEKSAVDKTRFVFKRKGKGSAEQQYIIPRAVPPLREMLVKELQCCMPLNNSMSFETFLPSVDHGKLPPELRAAELMEMLGLASYEITGGQDLQVFVRINDPLKVKSCADNPKYKNSVLADITNRNERSVKIMNAFFMNKMSNEERWNVIENYFLGNFSELCSSLGIEEVGA